MTRLLQVLTLAFALLPVAAQAGLTVAVDLSAQSMTVSDGGRVLHRFPISSGRDGYRTPNGTYRPQRLVRMHYSRKYDMSPMPYSIFFRGGYAIHGTGATGRLGRTASHGCIRLAPGAAARLYQLVQSRGAGNTRIVISGNAAVADGPRRARPARALMRNFTREVVAEEPAPRPQRRLTPRPRAYEVYDPYGAYAPAPVYYLYR
ncbi:MAG TPA: L,D-transpeptidase [Beijerinckiaceae bacterium]|jgi:hypothetical protein